MLNMRYIYKKIGQSLLFLAFAGTAWASTTDEDIKKATNAKAEKMAKIERELQQSLAISLASSQSNQMGQTMPAPDMMEDLIENASNAAADDRCEPDIGLNPTAKAKSSFQK